MKRHAGLIPFSHDHHDALIIAQRLRQGHSKAPRSQWPAAPEAQRDCVLEFYRDHLRHHLAAKEEILFPLARRFLDDQADLVDELQQEHEDLRHGLEELEGIDPQQLQARLKAWAKLLYDHIRKEERRLFQTLQEQVPEKELTACKGRVEAFYAESGRRQDPCLF